MTTPSAVSAVVAKVTFAAVDIGLCLRQWLVKMKWTFGV